MLRNLREMRVLQQQTLEALRSENRETLTDVYALHYQAMEAVLALGDAIPVALQSAHWKGVASALKDSLAERPAAGGEVLQMVGRQPRRREPSPADRN